MRTSLRIVQTYWIWLAVLLLAAQLGVEIAMGRPWVGESGTIRLWTPDGITGQSSQHIADWYTFSHIIHGMLFYAMIRAVCRWRGWKIAFGPAMLVAMGLEITWELWENSTFVIHRYRQHTAAVDYAGDTIMNSMFDTVWMMLGFAVAQRLPWKITLLTALVFELLAGWAVRDNLTLNVLTFIWPVEVVVDWQNRA